MAICASSQQRDSGMIHERCYLGIEPKLRWELHEDLRICTLYAERKGQITCNRRTSPTMPML